MTTDSEYAACNARVLAALAEVEDAVRDFDAVLRRCPQPDERVADDPLVRRMATDPAAIAAGLADDDSRLRSAALAELNRRRFDAVLANDPTQPPASAPAPADGLVRDEAVVAALCRAAAEDPDPRVQAGAVGLLGDYYDRTADPSVCQFFALVADRTGDFRVRQTAYRSLLLVLGQRLPPTGLIGQTVRPLIYNPEIVDLYLPGASPSCPSTSDTTS